VVTGCGGGCGGDGWRVGTAGVAAIPVVICVFSGIFLGMVFGEKVFLGSVFLWEVFC